MAAAAGLQCGFGAPLGRMVLDDIRALGITIVRIDLQESSQEDTVILAQEVLDAGLQPLCIIRRPEQIPILPEGALIEVGNEPDLEHFGWTVAEYIAVGTACVVMALRHNRRIYLGAVSNLNARGFDFLKKLPWDLWCGEQICCSVHRYPDGHAPQNPHQGFNDREHEVANLKLIVGDRPLAVTEVGYHNVEWTEAEAADNMAWERQFFTAQGFEIVSAFQLNDGPGGDTESHYGFRRMDGSWKAVAYAFANTTFPPLDGTVITLKSHHGGYMAVGQNQIVIADRPNAGAWEQFQVTRLDETHIALRSWQWQYVTAELDDSLRARSSVIGPWETWTFEPQPDGTLALKSFHGKYLAAEVDGTLAARTIDGVGPWESWTSDPADWWVKEEPVGNPNTLVGALSRNRRVISDETGPRMLMCCHFMEGFSAFVHNKSLPSTEGGYTVQAQLTEIAKHYGAVRNLDVLGYWDEAWAGREVTPIEMVANSGAIVQPTPNYWEKKREYVTLIHELGLRIMDDRGDMNSWSRQQKIDHMFQNGQFYASLPFGKDVLLGVWSCNEAWQNGGDDRDLLIDMLDAFEAGAGWLPAINGLSSPGGDSDPDALAETDPPMSSWEPEMPDSFEYWSKDASVITCHGNRANHAYIIEHYFGYGYDEQIRDIGKPVFNTEPVGGGDGVSVGQVNDPELLCAITAAALLGGQAWTFMSGAGVFWDAPIESMVAFKEVARLTQFLPNDVAEWPIVCHSGSRFEGVRILAVVDPTRADQSISEDGRFIIVVHTHEQDGNALPCEIACSEFTVINMLTGEIEREGPLAVGETYRHNGEARLVVGQLANGAASDAPSADAPSADEPSADVPSAAPPVTAATVMSRWRELIKKRHRRAGHPKSWSN